MDFNRFHGVSMDFIEFRLISDGFDFNGFYLIDFDEFRWISMNFNRCQLNSIDFKNFNGFQLISMDFHGFR